MTDTDSAAPRQGDRYREIALAVRAVIRVMENTEVRDQLFLLALQYERLALGLEAVSDSLRTATAQRSLEHDPPGP